MDSLLQFDNLSDRLSQLTAEIQYTTDSNNNNNNNNNEGKDSTNLSSLSTAKEDKYSLRPRSIRRVTEVILKPSESRTKHNKPHKPKQKPAPLSKYRRKTANARERNRMREINQAFETLRRVIPHMQTPATPPPQPQLSNATNEKLTKITTLRLAMKYISALSAALNNPNPSLSESLSSDYNSDLDYCSLLLESDGESLPLSDHSLLASPDFPEPSLSPVDFTDPSLPALLHTDFTEHALEPSDFSDFLLT